MLRLLTANCEARIIPVEIEETPPMFNPELFLRDLRVAVRSLARAKGLVITVVITLALGIGANAAIFSVVRGVLLKPLANRDEERLVYIRQTATGIGADDTAFSVPEIQDLRARVKTISAFGDFSTTPFTLVGLGDPREVRAGVVGGSYFDVVGLRPVLGRLINANDDGPNAAGAAVLTYRFWTTDLKSDPNVIGKTVRLGERTATIIGVLEPSVPYPAETEIIANIVTSPHHLSATMVTGRVHRMTELFGRLAPGADLEAARTELVGVHKSIVSEHPEAYPSNGNFGIQVVRLRDQITSRARNVLLVLLAASALVFIIAVSNVANLILARTVRREGELAVRAALGASSGALRRTLLAETVLLCGTGALLGVLIARPMVAILAQYTSRFSVRALDVTVDSTVLWVGATLAVLAAVLLAFVPRLPNSNTSQGLSISTGSVRITGSTNRRLRVFAMTQIAASFVLLAGAGMLLKTLIAMQTVPTGFDTQQVLALNVPVMSYGKTKDQIVNFYKETIRRIGELPGVDRVALGTQVPWRDEGFGPGFEFTGEGYALVPGEAAPRARFRTISPGFFTALGVPLVAGRDFNADDRPDKESVVIISESIARRLFNTQDAVNRHITWTDPVMKFVDVAPTPKRIVGVVADVDDENVVPGPAMTVYHPFEQQQIWSGRLFVHSHSDPYALVAPITKIIHEMSGDQPIERAATLEDIRAEVLAPDRLNTLVFGGFAMLALLISVVGVAGVLAFSVSGRTREFGVRLALGALPGRILSQVLVEGIVIGVLGIAAGGLLGFALARLIGAYVENVKLPGAVPLAGSVGVILLATLIASLLPAMRAARIEITQALRSG
jgi:putative ABC transport system permease protein